MDIHSSAGNRDQEIPDGILVRRSVEGDHQAFADLAERYRPVLEGCVSRWCPDRHLVPDLVQGVLLQLYVSLPTLRVDRSLKAWLVRVAHNCCVNEHRRRRPLLFSELTSASREEEVDLLAALPDSDPLPEEQVEQQEGQKRVMQAIRALPLNQRRVVWLKYTDQLGFAEIGRRLHLPAETAKTYFARAKPTLRRLLSEEGSAPMPDGSPRARSAVANDPRKEEKHVCPRS